ncbi:MAG: NusG domain II-containing protein [Oscillospiraceae bacterium]|nr:NusG domain II-containing protein [Oscillospiraceae bacterium]
MNWKKVKGYGFELLLLLAVAAVGIFWYRWQADTPAGAGTEATVTYDGKAVLTIPLNKDGFYQLEEDPSVQFEVKNGAVSFVNASCPDRLCEREGFLSKAGQTAVCLPRKTILRISGGEAEVDLIAR